MRVMRSVGIFVQGIIILLYALLMACIAFPFALGFFIYVVCSFLFDELTRKLQSEDDLPKMLPPAIYPLQRCLILRYSLDGEDESDCRHYVVAGNPDTVSYRKVTTQEEYAKTFFKAHVHDNPLDYIQTVMQAIIWLRELTGQNDIHCSIYSAALGSDGTVTMRLIHFC